MKDKQRLKEVGKKTQFSKDNQPSTESKSKGQINLAKERNILQTLRTSVNGYDLTQKTVKVIAQEVANGDVRNAIKLLSIIKENEVQEIKNTGSIEVQKVFVTKEEQKEIDKSIDDVIDG